MDVLKTLNWVYLHNSTFLKAILKFWTMAVIQFIVWKVNNIQGGCKIVYYFSIWLDQDWMIYVVKRDELHLKCESAIKLALRSCAIL